VGDLVRANDTTPLVVINQLALVCVTFAVLCLGEVCVGEVRQRGVWEVR
jgi:hypothetical protein